MYVDVNAREAGGEVLIKNTMVDTDAPLTIPPRGLLERVSIHPTQPRVTLELDDKRAVEAEIYAVAMGVEGEETTAVIVAFKDAVPVLGVFSLEILGLKIDPVMGRLEKTMSKGAHYFHTWWMIAILGETASERRSAKEIISAHGG